MYDAVFGDKHSRHDYEAIMNYARITPPAVKDNYVDIAGGNSAIDLTEAVGGVVFDDGKIEFKFTLLSEEQKNRMKSQLHGRRVDIILEKEPEYYYDGRLSFTREERNGTLFELYLDARVKPYKMERNLSVHLEKLTEKEKDILLFNDRMPSMPKITIEGNAKLKYGQFTFGLSEGMYQIPEVTLYDGMNRLTVSGSGNLKLEYRKGMVI